MRKEFVTFYTLADLGVGGSPGTLFAESTSLPIDSRDVALATQKAQDITERHNARPYGFRFETRVVADPVPDGEGGTLYVEPKTVDTSGMYFLNGRLETVDEVEARNDPKERILRANMQGNDMWIVCITTNGYKSTQPFTEKDFLVNASGVIVKRGDDPRLVEYRTRKDVKQEEDYNKLKQHWHTLPEKR